MLVLVGKKKKKKVATALLVKHITMGMQFRDPGESAR